MAIYSDGAYLEAAKAVARALAPQLQAPFTLELWDGSCIPLGDKARDDYRIVIASAGTIGSLLRRPTMANLAIHYAAGRIDLKGDDLITLVEAARAKRVRFKGRELHKGSLLKQAFPLLFAFDDKAQLEHQYSGEETGLDLAKRDEKSFIQFHYDVGNEFYQLFLDPEMLYSCAYFTDWDNSLEQAQKDKLEMICRKLRLKPGERFLDVGCGWGALLCHAAQNFGVEAHGVTLSQAQHDLALEKAKALGIADKVTVELKNYEDLTGEFDKISSIGMYEHVGIANYPRYFGKLKSLLRDKGLLLNHGITRRAKRSKRAFRKIRPENRLIRKYIFPGSELDHIGHTLESMEALGFEIHDVEGWREHYAKTCRLWHQRLIAKEEEAVAQVGRERYRMWIAYLAGVSIGFQDGSLRIYQTLATAHKSKGAAELPPSRADLYR
ncbi:MAG: cyclopropane-fatty-acyl-phospholipid synthase [Limibacillus sp.]